MYNINIAQLAGLALISFVTAQDPVCGPFELTSTNGALFETEDGIQFPGPSFTTLNGSIFDFFPNNGSLFNLVGYPCTFAPYLTCRPSNNAAAAEGYTLSGPADELSLRSNSSFYVCPPVAVRNASLSLRTSTMTVSQSTQPFPGLTDFPPLPAVATVPLRYIFDNEAVEYLDIGTDGLNESQCLEIDMQGSGCTGSSLITSSGRTTIIYVSPTQSTSVPTAVSSSHSSTSSTITSGSTTQPSASSTTLVTSPTSTSGCRPVMNSQVVLALLSGAATLLASVYLL